MGSHAGNADERPLRDVFVRAFSLDRHEVANGDCNACVTAGACTARPLVASRLREPCASEASFAASGLVLPIPAALMSNSKLAEPAHFDDLQALTAPAEVNETKCGDDPRGPGVRGAGGGPTDERVDVVDARRVRIFDWALLDADTPGSLTQRLDANGVPDAPAACDAGSWENGGERPHGGGGNGRDAKPDAGGLADASHDDSGCSMSGARPARSSAFGTFGASFAAWPGRWSRRGSSGS